MISHHQKNPLTATLLAIALVINSQDAIAALPAGGGLEVHEWGTFTSLQGSDGVDLEGLHHEEEGLPPFVHALATLRPARQALVPLAAAPAPAPTVKPPKPPRPPRPPMTKGIDFDVEGVTQKMETPVIYFHTATPRAVTVKVDFTGGLLTQWYPAASAISPAAPEDAAPVDISKVERSSLTWRGEVLPAPAKAPAEIPAVDASDPWAFAREVDSAPFRTVDARGRGEAENYIFYRGLGSFSLPVRMAVSPDGRAVVANGGAAALPVAFSVEVNADTARFARLGAVAAGAAADASLAHLPLEAKAPAMERLAAAVTQDLTREGLFADEARAMVRTWARQWFGTPGTRVLYLVPAPEIERVLPLAITPAPSKTVRVLLGRLEYLTPATEAGVEAALKGRLSSDSAVRAEAEAALAKLDRFLEPHVRRAQAHSSDPEVKASAAEVLETAKQ